MEINIEFWAKLCAQLILLSPFLAVLLMALVAALELPVQERQLSFVALTAIALGFVGSLILVALMLYSGERSLVVELGHWVALPEQHFHFTFEFLVDHLSLPFLLLSQLLSGVVGAFTRVYLHREAGFQRFYLLYMLFVLGVSLSAVAGTIEMLFTGWELVGLSSALLVAFFQDRPASVRNGLHVWGFYRIADAAFLIAALAFHHLASEGDFVRMTGTLAWPEGVTQLSSQQALWVGLLILVAAAGKSGLLPFSSWLPRAMEGPTPSSAIFYGALSVHLGAYLLLRMESILERSWLLSLVVVALGLATALWATLTTRAMSDIKGKLACSSLTQVGLIVAEIGLGFRYLALIHIIGHAILRTLQLLRAPSLLHDSHQIELALGSQIYTGNEQGKTSVWVMRLYRWGYERALFDLLATRFVIVPFQRFFGACGKLEDRWIRFLSGHDEKTGSQAKIELGGLNSWRR